MIFLQIPLGAIPDAFDVDDPRESDAVSRRPAPSRVPDSLRRAADPTCADRPAGGRRFLMANFRSVHGPNRRQA